MEQKKIIEHPYRWTIKELSEICDVSESYLYRLIREYRLTRAPDGKIDGLFPWQNMGKLTRILPEPLKTEYTDFVRKIYHLPPPGQVSAGAIHAYSDDE